MTIEIMIGDITQQDVDAIVNSANPSLLAGGGVCGAIHRAAGPELEIACKAYGNCPPGKAVITPGFKLNARYVIHAVCARWYGGNAGEMGKLEECYRSVFELIKKENIRSVAIPAIGTGIYRIPLDLATAVAIDAAREQDAILENTLIRFVCFDDVTLHAYSAAIQGEEV